MKALRAGVYPGSFDPLTVGHLDVIERALRIVDELIVGIATNPNKAPLFSVEERVQMVLDGLKEQGLENAPIKVLTFNKLLVDFAREHNVQLVIRGLRAVVDFEYEFQMTSANTRLDSSIETVFLMARDRHHFISSRMVKELAVFGGDISQFVPTTIARRVAERMAMTL